MIATEFYKIIQNEESVTNFLIARNLLVNVENILCNKCDSEMKYYIKKYRGNERKLLWCKRKGCQTTQSIRKNNSFWTYIDKNGLNNSGLRLAAQLELVYYWCQNLKQTTIITLTGRSDHTVCDWMNLCRDYDSKPFYVKVDEVDDDIQEDLIELQNDRNCKDTFESSMNIEEFWCKKAITYPKLREIALRYLVMFSTTYMCEQGFSALLYIKNKQRNRLDATKDMRVALSNITPRISLLVKEMQAQKSH
ncbi:protein FAM200A-like [Acyrthosiphon pisum]|uniref:HAT C-terminal dimerisation domain-containing protein n=1 Tax=Acyrthosiphon pisum TaxID=7029 RepID=A0A8R2JKS9_ACYPI|nr:protein FAM200A-like [Acyrthosiphon pisum]